MVGLVGSGPKTMDLCAGVDYSPQIIPLWGHAACRLNRPALSTTSTGMLILCFPSQESVGLVSVGQIKDEQIVSSHFKILARYSTSSAFQTCFLGILQAGMGIMVFCLST